MGLNVSTFNGLLIQIHRTDFNQVSNRDKRETGTASFEGYNGAIFTRFPRSNVTQKTAAYFIPREAFLAAANSTFNYKNQFFVILFKNRSIFPSSLNTSQVKQFVISNLSNI